MNHNYQKETMLLQQKLTEVEANTIMWKAITDDALMELKEIKDKDQTEAPKDRE